MNAGTRLCLAASVLAVSLWGCSSDVKDIQVTTQEFPKTHAKEYRSYAWAAAGAVVRDPDHEWTPPDLDIGSEIKFLVDRELRKHGLTEAFSDPDVLVIYAVGVDMKALDLVVDQDDAAIIEESPKGALSVIVAEPGSRRVVWAGYAEADLMENPTVELGKKRLEYAVKTMFKKFPLP